MNIFKKETMQDPLLQKLELLLKGHDWHYMRSDDHRYYMRGRAEYDRIRETMEEFNNNTKVAINYLIMYIGFIAILTSIIYGICSGGVGSY